MEKTFNCDARRKGNLFSARPTAMPFQQSKHRYSLMVANVQSHIMQWYTLAIRYSGRELKTPTCLVGSSSCFPCGCVVDPPLANRSYLWMQGRQCCAQHESIFLLLFFTYTTMAKMLGSNFISKTSKHKATYEENSTSWMEPRNQRGRFQTRGIFSLWDVYGWITG